MAFDASGEGIGAAFLAASRDRLRDDYMPKLRGALAALPAGDLWWRPNDASNSVGNLLLHLEGNLRQWVVAGVGGEPDTRRRDAEFAAEESEPADALMARLDAAVLEADRVMARVRPDRLLDPVRIQEQDVTVLEALYHAVEHFGMHTGQVILIAKLRVGRDLGFYRMEGGVPRRTW